ncbi:MAG: HEPN domain-containing protein [bacterium]
MLGEEFLEVSKSLLKTPKEAAYRTAVNRAYYAVFHCCAAFFRELGFKISDGPQTHGQLLARINNCGTPELQSIYNDLVDLYKHRLLADYDLNSSFFHGQSLVALIVASADQIIAAVKRCQQSQDLRLQIRNGIREYERKINP